MFFISYLQKSQFDILSSWLKNDVIFQNIQKLRNDFDSFYEATERDVVAPRPRRRSTASTCDARTNFRVLFNEIIDTITQHMQTIFSDFVKIRFLDLLDCSKYREYQETFPDESFKCLLDSYDFAFDEIPSKNQLIFLYSLTDFQGKSRTEMRQFFSNNPASKAALSQVYLLCSLNDVIPVSTSCVERSFSSLKRIKLFSRNKTGQDRLSDLQKVLYPSSHNC